MRNSLRTLLIGVALIAALAAVPTALADHSPYVDLTDELLLPHELAAAIAPNSSLTLPVRQLMAGKAGTDGPDLYAILPTDPIGGTPAVFVDIYEEPGKLLFRFDSVVANRGGTLQIYCQDCTSATNQKVWQIIWPGGRPPADDIPDPYTIPSNTQLAQDLLASGAVMLYSARSGHHHYHYDFAAWYELIIPGEANRRDNKVGFCMYDTYGGTGEAYFPGGQNNGWCRFMEPNADFAHMGISPDHGDMYNAQLADQWIDVTDLPPGEYTLEATVNPQNTIIESDTTNNVLSVTRTIPGATATPTTATTPLDTAAAIALGGTIVGHDIPSILDNCSVWDSNCYETASSSALTYDIEDEPDHGTVTITGNGLTATATYTPDPGHIGPDAFTYTTTDSRDLKSLPATVTITVGNIIVNTPPTAEATSATTNEQIAVNIDLSGSDPEACELTFSIVDPPANGGLEQISDAACSAGSPNTWVAIQ